MQTEAENEMQKALPDYARLRADLAAGTTRQDSEHAAMRGHSHVKELYEDKLRGEFLDCEAELDRQLSVQQVEYLSDGEERVLRRKRVTDAGVKEAMEDASRLLSEARRMSGIKYEQEKDALCRGFVAQNLKESKATTADIDAAAEAKRIADVLDRARKLDQAEYTKARDDLAAELCVRRSAPRPATYGARYVNDKPVPIPSATSRLLFSETALDILAKRKS